MTEEKQQSKNWNKWRENYKTYFNSDKKIPGFPFNEKFPKMYGGKRYQLILSVGEMCMGEVDDSKEFYSEGLEWKLLEDTIKCNRGQIIDRENIVAWKEI
jgi:hypothetical protein